MNSGDTLVIIVDYRLAHDVMRRVSNRDVFFINNYFSAPHSVDSVVLMRHYVDAIRTELQALVREKISAEHRRTLISVHIAQLDLRSRLVIQDYLRQCLDNVEIGCHSSLDATNDFVHLICGNRYFPSPEAWESSDFRALLTQAPTDDIDALLTLTARRARGDEKAFFDLVHELSRQIAHEDKIHRDDIAQVLEGVCLVAPEATPMVLVVKENIKLAQDAVLIRTAVAELISFIAPTLWHNK